MQKAQSQGTTRWQMLKSLDSTTRVPGGISCSNSSGPWGDKGVALGECQSPTSPTCTIMESLPVLPSFPAFLWEPSELIKWNCSATFKSYWHSFEALLLYKHSGCHPAWPAQGSQLIPRVGVLQGESEWLWGEARLEFKSQKCHLAPVWSQQSLDLVFHTQQIFLALCL